MELSAKYQKKTDKQHVLDNPDTYIGSVETVDATHWIMKDSRFQLNTHSFVPGLFKLFDEAIVNCRDHVVRMESINPVTYIHIDIQEDGTISFTNDGDGIDVALHPEYQIYIPELIFGHLRTSTNYDKTEKKIVGGKNGFGVKLIFIWSTEGEIETVDAKRKLKYVQSFHSNLDSISPPKITSYSKKAYTKITFKPDYARLGLSGLDESMRNVFIRRIYDISAVTSKKVKVSYNGEVVPVHTFSQYVDCYIGAKEERSRVIEAHDRWEYTLCLGVDEFTHVSFVNGIHTAKGGKHVEYIMNQITRKLVAYIKLKKKVDVKPSTLKEQMMLFLHCSIENPGFDSQTKEYMTTPASSFGSSCEVSDKFIDKIASKSGLGLMDIALTLTQAKESIQTKKHDGIKSKTIRGIPKLVDANYAGTAKSGQCTLLLCEGDSAKAGVVSGLSKEDRNYYGVYPLKGKLLNVRDELSKKIHDNKEIHEIKQIMGLEKDYDYTQEDITSKLRYSKILFITDQDLDGSHIKGLGINLFDSLWGSLLKHPQFLGFMNTPIIKAKKGSAELLFYNDGEYEAWKETGPKGWKVKYYKGLGTSTSDEFKEYFKHKKVVYFEWNEESQDSIDKVFNKKRADDRKVWLEHYSRTRFLDTSRISIGYHEFVNDEMIHFSKYDCDRSIPNLVDGLKISQRKILYCAFKKNLVQEIKVAQFSGYVSENSAYHHGEASLNGAIVGMAQNFVGSNNIHLLEPNGQFGTRLQGGKDSASERYIFTQLNVLTRKLFPKEDDAILEFLSDDGFMVEPKYYIPILPMVLINGCKGIGTGFSTDIPCYSPDVIKAYLLEKLHGGSPLHEFIPYYKGFKGTIVKEDKKFILKGVYTVKDTTVHITELPIGTWTEDYKAFLEDLVSEKLIKDYTDNSTDKVVDFTVRCISLPESIEKFLKLTTSKSTSNMHLFNEHEQLKKYSCVEDILLNFYEVRLKAYEARRLSMLQSMEVHLLKITNKVKYIKGVLEDALDLRKKNADEITKMLRVYGLDEWEDSYSYLIKLPMDSVSKENVKKLLQEEADIKSAHTTLSSITCHQMWIDELMRL
jgi:DNA topoisomerase-2